MRAIASHDFNFIIGELTKLLAQAPDVEVGEWQAIQNNEMPQARTIEVEDVSIEFLMGDVTHLQLAVKPNLPWAEDHFQERVSGIPYNPPPSSEWWPYAQKNNSEFKNEEKFSHTYPERFWPKTVGKADFEIERMGLRFPLGDLEDLVHVLRTRPGTRQAYLPVWFPEDLAAARLDQRVPCTLGYHFLVRDGSLKVVYYIRSCDFFRHFRDDFYMAGRLGQWVAEQVNASPGNLVMHISSLHIFSAERPLILEQASQYMEED